MAKKKSTDPIFVSPDGGETVYQQLPDGTRVLVEQSQKAKDGETAQEEAEMVGVEAIELGGNIQHLGKHGKDIVPYGI